MRRALKSLIVLAAAWFATPAAAGCREGAVASLRALSPEGYAIYARMPDKAFFLSWITCDDLRLGLSTAVHESVHYLTAHADAFPLLGGGAVARPRGHGALFAPARIAGRFGASDFVSTYLRPGRASSAEDFVYLLDEVNAYAHDLRTAIDLRDLGPRGAESGQRDGLAATMAFVARYVETAQEREPDSWEALRRPEMAGAVSAIWGEAEGVMAASCGIPGFGIEDRGFIRRLCEPAARAAMGGVLGREPACPARCLAADPLPDGD